MTYYEREIVPQEGHQTWCCNASISCPGVMVSIVYISSWLSLFTRATKHFLPCWRSPEHTLLCEAVKEQYWSVHHDTCHRDVLKAHRDGHTTVPFSKSAVNKTAYVFTFTKCYSHFWIVWVFLFDLFLVGFVFCLMRKKLFTDKADQSWDSYSILLGSVSTLIRETAEVLQDCKVLALHTINKEEWPGFLDCFD